MNKIFQTLWNAERHQLVVVNEATGSAQSRGTAKHQTTTATAAANNRTAVKTVLSAAMTLAIGALTVAAAPAGAATYTSSATITTTVSEDELNLDPVDRSGSTPEFQLENFRLPEEEQVAIAKYHSLYPEGYLGSNPATLTVENSGKVSANVINLLSGNDNIEICYWYMTSYGSGGENDTTIREWHHHQVNYTETSPTSLVNNGGEISADELKFEIAENSFIQNSGISTIQTYSGGGLIDMNGGTLTLGTLSSDATVDADGGTIIAPVISLSDSTFSASNTELQTGLNQIADFQQVINQAQALLMASNDAKTSLNAKPLFC